MRPRRSLSESDKENYLMSVDDVDISLDKHARERVSWPRTGELDVQLFSCRALESTSVSHLHFLSEKYQDVINLGKRNFLLSKL